MKTDKTDKSLMAALAEFQAKFKGVKKTGYNTFTKSAYPTLDDVVNGTAGLLSECGIILYHSVQDQRLHTSLLRGEEVLSSAIALPDGAPQDIGAAITYYKRYNMCALLNIAEPDDDGESLRAPEAPTGATDEQWAAIAEFREAGHVSKAQEAWIEKQDPLTDAKADALLAKLRAKSNAAD